MNKFKSVRGRGSYRKSSNDRGGRREMFDAVCSNCGKNCQIPFQPKTDKPIYCSDCFEEMGGNEKRRSDRRSGRREFNRRDPGGIDVKEFGRLVKSVEAMSSKLDTVIKLLSPSEKEEKAESIVEEKKEVKNNTIEVVENIEPEVVEEKTVIEEPTKVTKTSKID